MTSAVESQGNIRVVLRESFSEFYSLRGSRKNMQVNESLKLLIKQALAKGISRGEIHKITGMPRSTLYELCEKSHFLSGTEDAPKALVEIPVRRLEVVESKVQPQVTIRLPSGVVIELEANIFVDGKVLSTLLGGYDVTAR